MIEIVPYSDKYYHQLISYKLEGEQERFSTVPNYILRNEEMISNKDRYDFAILKDGVAGGFFTLDQSKDRPIGTGDAEAVLLRALSVNPSFQGQGLAKNMLLQLPELVRNKFPEIKKIIFGVNFQNTNAYQLYLKTGYRDLGEVYVGPKGPQHIMVKEL